MTYILAFIPKAKICALMAGLLTYSTFSDLPIPIGTEQWCI